MNKDTFKYGCLQRPVNLKLGTPIFFFTNEMVEHHVGTQRTWMPARVVPEPVLVPDSPWEGRALNLFGTVLKSEDKYRLYYSSWMKETLSPVSADSPGWKKGTQDLLLAESHDGLSWSKNKLGVTEYGGNKDNNIIMLQRRYRADSPSLAHDCLDSEYPFKLVFTEKRNKEPDKWCICSYRSKDGISFEQFGNTLASGDRCNITSNRIDGKFEFYMRGENIEEEFGKRLIYRTTTEDFYEWTEVRKVLAPDLDDDKDAEFYGMSVFNRHDWRIGLVEYYRASVDEFEIQLAFSKDGVNWLRPVVRKPFISPSYEWNRKWNTCASNGPIIINDQMVFLFGGRRIGHNYDSVNFHGVIGMAGLPLDRFCAIEAGPEGYFVTSPLVWPGGELKLNADTRESFESHAGLCNGNIKIELLELDGTPIDGYSGMNAAVFTGNTNSRCVANDEKVRWGNGVSMDLLKGKTIRICFRMRHARLYTFTAAIT